MARSPTLSTNVALRLDGRPRSEASEPGDPGRALLVVQGKATVLACDRFDRVGDNIAAIAAQRR